MVNIPLASICNRNDKYNAIISRKKITIE